VQFTRRFIEHRGRLVNAPAFIREVPGSNLSPDTGYPDLGFSWLFSVPPGKFWDITLKLGHDRFLPTPFQLIIHLSSLYTVLNCLSN
jgi:hypothetical protein